MNVRSTVCAAMAVIAGFMLNISAPSAGVARHSQRSGNADMADAHPGQIAAAPDGSLWFTENRGIQHLSPSGRFRLFAVPGAAGTAGDNTPGSLVVDPRGTVWFTAGRNIGRLAGDGKLLLFPVSRHLGAPAFLTKGPDGTVWCALAAAADRTYNFAIARILPSGAVLPVFTWPKRGSIPGSLDRLDAFAVGAGHRIWLADTFVTNFTQGSGPTFVGYIDSHMRIVRFPLPRAIGHVCQSWCTPLSIVIGTDGVVWFGLLNPGLGRLTPNGVPSIISLPRSVIIVTTLAPGLNGKVWFGTVGSGLGYVTRAGRVRYFALSPHRTDGYEGVASVPDGSLWFTIACQNSIGHITSTGKIKVVHIPGTVADAGAQCPGLP